MCNISEKMSSESVSSNSKLHGVPSSSQNFNSSEKVSNKKEKEIPFFTVARYKTNTAPSTFEYAVNNPPLHFGRQITSPPGRITSEGGGEGLYNGSLEASLISPVELAFGPQAIQESGLRGKKPRDRWSYHEDFKTCVKWESPFSSSVNKGYRRNDRTPVGCLHKASGRPACQENYQKEVKSKQDTLIASETSQNVPKQLEEASPTAEKDIPLISPRLNGKMDCRLTEHQDSYKRPGSEESISSKDESNTESFVPTPARRTMSCRVKGQVKPEVPPRRSIEAPSRLSQDLPKAIKPIKTREKPALPPKPTETKHAERATLPPERAYEDAGVSDAVEHLEQSSSGASRSSPEVSATPKTPRTPRSKSREPSFCLELDDDEYPHTEAQYMALLNAKILQAQERQMLPLKEDLADWLSKLLGITELRADNLIDRLDNGVYICKLADLISQKAQAARDKGTSNLEVPRLPYKKWERAKSGTFFARDNISNFLRFCRRLGVHDNLLFETEDLVCHTGIRAVVLCLLEVSRLAQNWWSLEPPGIIKLEKEIGEELCGRSDSGYSNTSSPRGSLLTLHAGTASPSSGYGSETAKLKRSLGTQLDVSKENATHGRSYIPVPKPRGPKPVLPPKPASIQQAVSNLSERPTSFPKRGWSGAKTTPTTPMTTPTHTAKQRLPVAKTPLSSGANTPYTTPTTPTHCRRYATSLQKPKQSPSRQTSQYKTSHKPALKSPSSISSICSRLQECYTTPPDEYSSSPGESGLELEEKLLKGKHVMVRVGGGWDTLEHYLLRHDPTQVMVYSAKSSEPFVQIRSRYVSPSPTHSSTSSRSSPVSAQACPTVQSKPTGVKSSETFIIEKANGSSDEGKELLPSKEEKSEDIPNKDAPDELTESSVDVMASFISESTDIITASITSTD